MANPTYLIEILGSDRLPITRVLALVPLNDRGDVLEYSDVLSGEGECKLRISTLDTIFVQHGDILKPWVNHIRITRGGVVVWQGVIVDVPERNERHLEVKAKTYLTLLSRRRIKHDTTIVAGDQRDQYRTLETGTLASWITTFINETKNGSLANMTTGTIDNPNFPNGFIRSNGQALTGAWTFSADMTLQFSYTNVLKVISQLGIYALCDFELTRDLVFNWRTKIGNDKTNLVMSYGQYGNIETFNSPLYGSRLVNDLIGIAADVEGNVLHSPKRDEASIQQYGQHDGEAGFSDVSNQNALITRTNEELRLVSQPDAELQMVLSGENTMYGQYAVGDTVTVKIQKGIIDYNAPRRIIGIKVVVHNTNKEHIKLDTNKPR